MKKLKSKIKAAVKKATTLQQQTFSDHIPSKELFEELYLILHGSKAILMYRLNKPLATIAAHLMKAVDNASTKEQVEDAVKAIIDPKTSPFYLKPFIFDQNKL